MDDLRFLTTSRSLLEQPIIRVAGIKKIEAKSFRHLSHKAPPHDCVVGWGRKRTGYEAQQLASQYGSRLLLLEDGFLRSYDRDDLAMSVVIDDLGIYYDASGPSRLEQYIKEGVTTEQACVATDIVRRWQELKVSKYNSAPDYQGDLPERFVLVVDQVAGDESIRYGQADHSTFQNMIYSALAENPGCDVVIKVHPDSYTKAKCGHYDLNKLASNPRIWIIAENCHKVSFLQRCNKIYTVTSQVGFEGLLWNKTVRCFGMPFYAGWGLTDDDQECERRQKVPFEWLVYATLVRYPVYMDADTKESSNIFQVMEYIANKRQHGQCSISVDKNQLGVPSSVWRRYLKALMGS
jgi:capsular polysaccharide export protein